MTRRSIEEQIDVIRTTTERISVSPEAAAEFLQRAGIIRPVAVTVSRNVAHGTGKWVVKASKSGKFVSKKSKKK